MANSISLSESEKMEQSQNYVYWKAFFRDAAKECLENNMNHWNLPFEIAEKAAALVPAYTNQLDRILFYEDLSSYEEEAIECWDGESLEDLKRIMIEIFFIARIKEEIYRIKEEAEEAE